MLTVRSRVSLLIFALGMVFAGIFAVWRMRSLEQYRLYWQALQTRQRQMVTSVFDMNAASQQSLCSDYTAWDELVNFARKPSAAWAAKNLDPALDSYQVDVIWLYDLSGKLIYSVHRDARCKDLPVPFMLWQPLLAKKPFCRFFGKTVLGFIEVRGARLYKASNAGRTGPCFGYFLVGRLYDGDQLASLTILTGGLSSILDPSAKDDYKPQEGVLFTEIDLPGVSGSPAAVLRVTEDQPLLRNQKKANDVIGLSMAVFMVVLMITLSLALHLWVTRPLSQISKALGNGVCEGVSGLARSKTEFGEIARLISAFVEQQAKLASEIGARAAIQKQLERLNAELERRVDERTADLQRTKETLEREMEERVNAEQALVATETKFRNLVEQSLIGICIVDNDRITYANPRFASLFRHTVSDIQNLSIVNDLCHEDDRSTLDEVILKVLQGRAYTSGCKFTGLNADGSFNYVEISCATMTVDDHTVLVGMLVDADRRKSNVIAPSVHRRRKTDPKPRGDQQAA